MASVTSSITSVSTDILGLNILTNTTWNVYSSSPLYRLNYSEIYLKKLAKWLREQLAAAIPLKSKEIITYDVKFEIVPNITGASELEAIMITVLKLKNEQEIPSYKGIFLSRGSHRLNQEDGFKVLPTLICKSNEYTANIVHTHLEKLFDCKIYPLELNELTLKWLCILYLNSLDRTVDSDDSITLTYNFKKGSDFNFTVKNSQLLELWTVLHHKNEEITEGKVEHFFKIVEFQFFTSLSMNVSLLNLQELKSSNFSIKVPCKVKITDLFFMNEFLVFIQDLTT